MAASAGEAKMDKTLVKGLAVLERLAPAREPVRLVDLSRDLGLAKSGVHRLLQTLVKLGYVSAEEGGRYSATMKMWHLGCRIIEQIDSYRTLHPFLKTLANESMETAHLTLLDGDEVIYIDMVEGLHSMRVTSVMGSRAPAHCIATGKVHLAHQPPEVIASMAGRLTRYTSKTITNLTQLEKELAKIRRDGHAINRSEWQDGICGVAAPVWDSSKQLVFSIGVTVPAIRFVPAARERLIGQVTAVARQASVAMGARMPGVDSAG